MPGQFFADRSDQVFALAADATADENQVGAEYVCIEKAAEPGGHIGGVTVDNGERGAVALPRTVESGPAVDAAAVFDGICMHERIRSGGHRFLRNPDQGGNRSVDLITSPITAAA